MTTTEPDLFAELYATKIQAQKIRIEFDGGTPCNIPRLGYGIGYGSYQIQNCATGEIEPVVRVDHKRPMSANAAEVLTLVRAIQEVVSRFGREVELDIHGDSQIALKWARGATESGRKIKTLKQRAGSDEFLAAVLTLRDLVKGFPTIKATWRGRQRSVEVFGH